MKVARSVAEVLSRHTTLSLECVDRMYLNVYVPLLQSAAGAAHFFRKMRGAAWPSSVLMAPITERFINAIKSYAERNGIGVFRRICGRNGGLGGPSSDSYHARVLAAVKARRSAPPPLRGADGLDAGSAHERPGSCLTRTNSRRPHRRATTVPKGRT